MFLKSVNVLICWLLDPGKMPWYSTWAKYHSSWRFHINITHCVSTFEVLYLSIKINKLELESGNKWYYYFICELQIQILFNKNTLQIRNRTWILGFHVFCVNISTMPSSSKSTLYTICITVVTNNIWLAVLYLVQNQNRVRATPRLLQQYTASKELGLQWVSPHTK